MGRVAYISEPVSLKPVPEPHPQHTGGGAAGVSGKHGGPGHRQRGVEP